MVETCFGLVWMELRPECWICNDLCNGLERNQNGLERTIYVPYFDHVACNFNKKRSNGLEMKSRSSPFAVWVLYQSKNGCFVQGNDLTDCLWLGIPELRPTSIIQNILLWELIAWLDPSSVCPWSFAWSLTLLSLDLDQLYAQRSYLAAPTLLGNDATVNMGGSLAFPFLLLSDQSYSFCCERSKFSTATMSHIQVSNTLVGYCWHVVKPFIAVLMLYMLQVVG